MSKEKWVICEWDEGDEEFVRVFDDEKTEEEHISDLIDEMFDDPMKKKKQPIPVLKKHLLRTG